MEEEWQAHVDGQLWKLREEEVQRSQEEAPALRCFLEQAQGAGKKLVAVSAEQRQQLHLTQCLVDEI